MNTPTPTLQNRDVYRQDPDEISLLNHGVAAMTDAATADERRILRFELRHFVCAGQYRGGLVRILESYLRHQGQPEQPAAWISGFFGSGKSHLAKMLRFLWTDFTFPEDGATARGLARLPDEVRDLLAEVSHPGSARARAARRGRHAGRRRRGQRPAGAARHRLQVRRSAGELAPGAVLPVAQEEPPLRPGARRGRGGRAAVSARVAGPVRESGHRPRAARRRCQHRPRRAGGPGGAARTVPQGRRHHHRPVRSTRCRRRWRPAARCRRRRSFSTRCSSTSARTPTAPTSSRRLVRSVQQAVRRPPAVRRHRSDGALRHRGAASPAGPFRGQRGALRCRRRDGDPARRAGQTPGSGCRGPRGPGGERGGNRPPPDRQPDRPARRGSGDSGRRLPAAAGAPALLGVHAARGRPRRHRRAAPHPTPHRLRRHPPHRRRAARQRRAGRLPVRRTGVQSAAVRRVAARAARDDRPAAR